MSLVLLTVDLLEQFESRFFDYEKLAIVSYKFEIKNFWILFRPNDD